MITLEPLSEKNFRAVTRLEVAFDQANFVAPNVFSIAEAKIYNYLQPRVVYRDSRAVGFALYGQDPETRRYYIVRLMIDTALQGQGLGREAVRLLVAEMVRSAGRVGIYLSVAPDNIRARRLYEGMGFLETGEIEGEGEIVYRLDEDKAVHLSCAEAQETPAMAGEPTNQYKAR